MAQTIESTLKALDCVGSVDVTLRLNPVIYSVELIRRCAEGLSGIVPAPDGSLHISGETARVREEFQKFCSALTESVLREQ